MKIYLAEGGSLFHSNYKLYERERERENVQLYLAGTERVICDYKKEKKMNIYLLSTGNGINNVNKEDLTPPENLFNNTNILQSFFYANKFTEDIIIPNCKNFLLDSGAFSFMNGKKSPNWNLYIDDYCNFINKNNIKRFFELDIDNIIGFDDVLKIRKVLENKTGVKPIPVWHKSRGLEQFKRDCYDFEYVAVGGIVTKEISSKFYPVFSSLIDIAHKNQAKIHGLGFTNLRGLTRYKFDSVDSTAWVSGNRFGAIYYFDGKTMKKIKKSEGKRVNSSKTALHNFNEWKKFCTYAEKNL